MQPAVQPRARALPLALLALFAAPGLGACAVENDGITPPRGELNFPIAVSLSPRDGTGKPPFLYVASSNFDLRYNAGSVQAFDLHELERRLPQEARDVVVDPLSVMVLSPDGTSPVNAEVRIGAHAAAMALAPAGDRLYLAVRSDADLTFIDVDPLTGALECGGGQAAFAHRCDDAHRRGDRRLASPRNVALPAEPTGIVAGALSDLGLEPAEGEGDWILMSHRSGRASLFLTEGLPGGKSAPLLLHVVEGLPPETVNIAYDPATDLAWLPSASGSQAFIGRVGIAPDRTRLDTSFLYDAGAVAIAGVDDGTDARDLRFVTLPDGTRAALVLSRRPEALLVVDLDRSRPGSLRTRHAVEVGFGPSRIEVGTFLVGSETRTLAFASCYDSRDVWVIDPALGEVLTVVRGMSGPFTMAVDAPRERIYVADFRASVVRAVSLSPFLACLAGGMVGPSCEPSVLGTIGEPRPVGDLL